VAVLLNTHPLDLPYCLNSNTYLPKGIISIIRGQLTDADYHTVVHSYMLDVHSETEFEPRLRSFCVSMHISSRFTYMEVPGHIYHQFFFGVNCLGRKPTTFQFSQPLTLSTVVLAASALHCLVSQYATWQMVLVLFSQDDYCGQFCPSMVTHIITAEATSLINYTLAGCLTHPPPTLCFSTVFGDSQSLAAAVGLHWSFNKSFHTPYHWCLGTSPVGWALHNPNWHSTTSIQRPSIWFLILYAR